VGHIRLGRLPRTYQWKNVFTTISSDEINPHELAGAVSTVTQDKFESSDGHTSINYCFWILVRLVTGARSNMFDQELSNLGVQYQGDISGPQFIQAISNKVQSRLRERGHWNIFGQISELSLRFVLSSNITQESQNLFGSSLTDIQSSLKRLSAQKQFGGVAKEFFGQYQTRLINYITDKEISNFIGPGNTLSNHQKLKEFKNSLYVYCLESARITEDFASGWYSKHNWETNNDISENATLGFTAYALEKLAMELRQSSL
jgi:hypothetical protein